MTSASLSTSSQPASLPDLVRRAATALASAETAAEILEARQIARLARDVLKREAAVLKAKSAHGDVIAAVRRTQADALEIESLADKRLADEYDAAQERGEVATGRDGPGAGVSGGNAKVTAAEIGLSRKEIHEARQIRDAEKNEPGAVRRILDEKLAAGEEPTRAALRAGISALNGKAAGERRSDPLSGLPVTPSTPDYGGLTADQRIAELEEHVRVLEADYTEVVTENRKYAAMRVQFEQGGFDKVIEGKDEEIRALQERVYSESDAKVRAAKEVADLKRKRDYWMGEAKKRGWTSPRAEDTATGYDDAFLDAAQAEG